MPDHNHTTIMNAEQIQNAQNADAVIVAEEHTGMTVKRMPKTMTEAKVKEIVRVYAQEDLKTELYEGMTEELRKLDEQVAENMESERRQMEELFEEKLADLRREMEDNMTAKIAQMLATSHPAVEKQAKKQKKAEGAEVKGYYDVPAGVDEIARLRKINAELRKESEGKTKTNQKLQEQIANLESEDPIAKYAEEIQRLKELNQDLRKRCVAKDKTNQNLKAEILRLGGSNAGSQDDE